jgi:diguanylate cyclase (GGDEF)-like protein
MVTKADDFFHRRISQTQKDFWDSEDFGSEQLDMFDKLDVALYSADMYAWEADYNAETVTRTDLPSGKGTCLSFDEFFSLINEEDAKVFKEIFLKDGKERRRTIDQDVRIKRNGSERWYKIRGTVYRVSRYNVYAAGVAYDVENTKEHMERLEYLKTHDYLTGLDNLGALDRLDESGSCLYPYAMVIACIDNLREINDSLGYLAGNNLIKNVAEVLKECFCDADFMVRIGGGEFCSVFSGKNDLEIGMKIKEANMMLHKMYLNLIKTEVSFGYAISDEQAEFFSLYKQAAARVQRNRELKRILLRESVADRLNDIISAKTGWGARTKRLQSLAAQVGSGLGCDEEQINEIKALAKIADLGLVGISDSLLINRNNLSEGEMQEYLRHIEIGRTLIASMEEISSLEALYLDVYRRYDEWQDGIALPSRIVAGAMCFDDISLGNKSAKLKSIISAVESQKGAKLCPKVVDTIAKMTTKHLAACI